MASLKSLASGAKRSGDAYLWGVTLLGLCTSAAALLASLGLSIEQRAAVYFAAGALYFVLAAFGIGRMLHNVATLANELDASATNIATALRGTAASVGSLTPVAALAQEAGDVSEAAIRIADAARARVVSASTPESRSALLGDLERALAEVERTTYRGTSSGNPERFFLGSTEYAVAVSESALTTWNEADYFRYLLAHHKSAVENAAISTSRAQIVAARSLAGLRSAAGDGYLALRLYLVTDAAVAAHSQLVTALRNLHDSAAMTAVFGRSEDVSRKAHKTLKNTTDRLAASVRKQGFIPVSSGNAHPSLDFLITDALLVVPVRTGAAGWSVVSFPAGQPEHVAAERALDVLLSRLDEQTIRAVSE